MKKIICFLLSVTMLCSLATFGSGMAFADDGGVESPLAKVVAGWGQTVALLSDGTAYAIGHNGFGECEVGDWTDLVDVAAGAYHTVGLRSDGTVVAVGETDDKRCDVSGWTDVVDVEAGFLCTVGLKSDGTVLATGKTGMDASDNINLSDWSDITAISTCMYHTVGLKSDGTVVARGGSYNKYGECDVSGWSDIVAVAAGNWHTVGLRADGTVVATKYTGTKYQNQCEVSGWTDIVGLAAGTKHTVGLRADGTVVATGDNSYGQCDVSGWTDIAAVSAGHYYTIGLKSDGTVLIIGDNTYGTSDAEALNSAISSRQTEANTAETAQEAFPSVPEGHGTAFADEFTLRNGIMFGDSFGTVQSKETIPLTGNHGQDQITGGEFIWTAPGTVSGYDNTSVGFFFDTSDRLIEMEYYFKEVSLETSGDSRYEAIYDGLVRKYGEPLDMEPGVTFPITSGAVNNALMMTSIHVMTGQVGVVEQTHEWVVPVNDEYSVKIDLVYYHRGKSYSDLGYAMRVGYRIFTMDDLLDLAEDSLTKQEIVDKDL